MQTSLIDGISVSVDAGIVGWMMFTLATLLFISSYSVAKRELRNNEMVSGRTSVFSHTVASIRGNITYLIFLLTNFLGGVWFLFFGAGAVSETLRGIFLLDPTMVSSVVALFVGALGASGLLSLTLSDALIVVGSVFVIIYAAKGAVKSLVN